MKTIEEMARDRIQNYSLNVDEVLLIKTFRRLYWDHDRHLLLDVARGLTKEDVEAEALDAKYSHLEGDKR